MINAAHLLLYSRDPDADRAFLRDTLGFPSVDAGRGWLIFGLPPAELAVHPAEDAPPISVSGDGVVGAALYLMCDDLGPTMERLGAKGVRFSEVEEPRWGSVTTFALPSGAKIGLYQPKHPTALELNH